MQRRPFLILIVIDGFGCRTDRDWNAIAQAPTPCFDGLFRESQWTTLEASGLAVGLPEGQMGNSEVGHLNIGAGRVVDQDIVRISKSAASGEMRGIPLLGETFARVKRDDRAVHLIGLLSDGGVHSLQQHLHGLIDAAIANGVERVYVHAILDGRDTSPKSAERYLQHLLDFLADKPAAQLATVIGRYYPMDRDRRWDRVQRGYDLWTLGVGVETRDPLETVRRFYEQNVTDEFMEPLSVISPDGAHRGRIEDGDAIIFFNFRADRMRQIVTAFKDAEFAGFPRAVHPVTQILTMNRYHQDFNLPVIYPPVSVHNHLGEVLGAAGLTQLRIAETEKYAHVTFFFNGGAETQSPGEERILIPSPKVATYDLQPEMSVFELANRVAAEVDSRRFDVVIMNIANPDMVGHTGVMDAAIRSVQATDQAVATILAATERAGGVALITADHGNCELMFDPATGQPHTAHTTNPVPLILVDAQKRFGALRGGGALSNVAPTILAILGIEKPADMVEESLLVPDVTVVA